MTNLLTITLSSTHHYLLDCPGGKLMVDTGWAGSLARLAGELKRCKVTLSEIRYVMITHHHPDHAGLTQEIKNACGAKLVIHERQIPYLQDLQAFYQDPGKGVYVPIRVEKGDIILPRSNRAVLKNLGIPGEALETPGHSEDSISLVLDGGMAFTGDLTLPFMAVEENEAVLRESWRCVLALNPRMIYPAHGKSIPAERLRKFL